MPYISGSVTINSTVTTEIRGTVKNELVGTNTRLEAIETELRHITSHLASIAKALESVNKKNGTKPHRHIESVAPPIAVQEEPEPPKKKSTKSSARGSVGKDTGTISGYTSSPTDNFSDFLMSMKSYNEYDDDNKKACRPF